MAQKKTVWTCVRSSSVQSQSGVRVQSRLWESMCHWQHALHHLRLEQQHIQRMPSLWLYKPEHTHQAAQHIHVRAVHVNLLRCRWALKLVNYVHLSSFQGWYNYFYDCIPYKINLNKVYHKYSVTYTLTEPVEFATDIVRSNWADLHGELLPVRVQRWLDGTGNEQRDD